MGSKNSTQGTECTCDYCGNHITEPEDRTTREETFEVCSRCHGPLAGERNDKDRPDTYNPLEEKSTELKMSIKRIQILPFKETLPEDFVQESEFLDEQGLLQEYLVPYFANNRSPAQIGTRFQIREIDFKVTACHPPIGTIDDKTMIRCMYKPLTVIQNIVRLHALPTKVSLDSACKRLSKRGTRVDTIESKELFDNYVQPYFACNSDSDEPKHIAQGELFMSRGIQFKIIAAEPWNGIVNSQTNIYTEGAALVDIERIHILPIFETLPNADKDISESEMMQKYLKPFFLGQHQYVCKDEDVVINGVDFKIMGVEPEAGLVTLNTEIHNNGSPIKADDITNQRMADDEAMARRLQQEEGGILRINVNTHEVRHGIRTFLDLASNGNENQRRALLEHLQRQQMLRLQEMGQPVNTGSNQGATQSEINSLPTREWTQKAPTGTIKEEEKETLTCMVCLMEYDEGEWLRTLPCFHHYHKDCIDKWLVTNNKCPMCKHPAS